jgi:hypothetical protein
MSRRVSRRSILSAAGALALPARAASKVPAAFDHMLLGCGDLDEGIAFVEEKLGVKASFGGVHPGRGSRNALLSLGKRKYLEIIAPDPEQPRSADVRGLYKLDAPRLIGWAAHVDDMDALIEKLTAARVALKPMSLGARQRPSAQMLRWKALSLQDDEGGLLPFFIEWSKDSPHPSTDAPAGCRLERFELGTPQPAPLRARLSQLSLDAAVVSAKQASLRAAMAGPKGTLRLPA